MTNEVLTTIAKEGLLGLLLATALITICFLYRETKKERDNRLEDIKEVWAEDMKFKGEIRSLIQSILDILRSGKK